MSVRQSILESIGNTPLLDIEGIYVRCEFLNPSGSIKDPVAKYFIEKAEQMGSCKNATPLLKLQQEIPEQRLPWSVQQKATRY
jgi:cysteine synthase